VDYEGALEIGNAKDQTLNEILNSDKMKQLRSGMSDTFCKYCSEYKSKLAKDRFKTSSLLQGLIYAG